MYWGSMESIDIITSVTGGMEWILSTIVDPSYIYISIYVVDNSSALPRSDQSPQSLFFTTRFPKVLAPRANDTDKQSDALGPRSLW